MENSDITLEAENVPEFVRYEITQSRPEKKWNKAVLKEIPNSIYGSKYFPTLTREFSRRQIEYLFVKW